MIGRRVSRLSGVAAAALVLGLISPLTTASADPALPYALVDSPAAGSVAAGVLHVTGEGHLDPGGADTAVSLILKVDGVATGDPVDCTTPPALDCTGGFDTGALAAGSSHTLLIELTTTGSPVDSDPVTVTVPAPIADPTVTLNFAGPPPAGNVTGPVSFTATGTVDAASLHSPGSLRLVVDGSPSGPSVACPAAAITCTETLVWDTTNATDGSHSVKARFATTSGGGSVDSDPITVSTKNPGPSVNITSPTNGSGQKGIISVTATGTTDGSTSETPVKMQLLRGGTVLDEATCGTDDPCTRTLTWDATGEPTETVTLVMKFFTADGLTSSDSVSVNVTSPAPKAAISSPGSGNTVSGNDVTVQAGGSVDPSQTDTASSIQLKVDGVAYSTLPCPTPKTRSCSVAFSWDASGETDDHTLQAVLISTAGATGASPIVHVTVQINPPTASISIPAAPQPFSGGITVVAHGAIHAKQNDTPKSIQFIAARASDNALVYASPIVTCPSTATTRTCAVPFTWDTSGLNGAYTLRARFTAKRTGTADSDATTVRILSPAPTVSITSPKAGSTVHSHATVTVSGLVNATQTDSPTAIQLLVDGKAVATQTCTPDSNAPRACKKSFPWTTTGLTGKHVLSAAFLTTNNSHNQTVVNRTAKAASSVYVYGGTRILLVGVGTTHAGKLLHMSGRVMALINRNPVAGTKIKVKVIPAVGKAKTLVVRTDARGYFRVGVKPAVNTTVSATMLALPYYGTSHTSTKVKVLPHPVCSAGSKVRHSVADHGVCKVAGLLKGTKVTLQYQFAGKWFTLGSGKAPGAKVPFTFRFAKPGAYLVRLVFAATRAFVASVSPSMRVAVT